MGKRKADAADAAADDKPATKPGIFKRIFGRRAPWWIKALRTAALLVTVAVTVDRAVVPNLPSRGLTDGEETMLREIFNDSVDYDKVRLHHSGLSDLMLGVMNKTAVARGNMIFIETTPDLRDYSRPDTDDYMKYAFVHETCHVWQEQNGHMPGMFNMLSLNCSRFLPGADRHGEYRYDVTQGKDLLDYNIEQQAGIITDFHLAVKNGGEPMFHAETRLRHAELRAAYEETLVNFNEDSQKFAAPALDTRNRATGLK